MRHAAFTCISIVGGLREPIYLFCKSGIGKMQTLRTIR